MGHWFTLTAGPDTEQCCWFDSGTQLCSQGPCLFLFCLCSLIAASCWGEVLGREGVRIPGLAAKCLPAISGIICFLHYPNLRIWRQWHSVKFFQKEWENKTSFFFPRSSQKNPSLCLVGMNWVLCAISHNENDHWCWPIRCLFLELGVRTTFPYQSCAVKWVYK